MRIDPIEAIIHSACIVSPTVRRNHTTYRSNAQGYQSPKHPKAFEILKKLPSRPLGISTPLNRFHFLSSSLHAAKQQRGPLVQVERGGEVCVVLCDCDGRDDAHEEGGEDVDGWAEDAEED